MTELDNAALAVEDSVHPEEGTPPESSAPDGDAPSENIQDKVDYESFAKVQGWSGKDKWRGDEDKWVDAETFVKRGQEFQSSLKASNQSLKRELQERKEADERTIKMFENLSKKAKDDALREIRDQQKLALEDDDNARYDELEGKKTKVHEDFRVEPPKQQIDPSIAAFEAENTWYGTDYLMTQKAEEYSQKMAEQGMSTEEQLREVKRYMVHEFPDKFENPRRQTAQTVSTNSPPSNVKKSKTISDMKPADQKMARDAAAACGMDLNDYVKECFKMENLS